MSASQDCSCIAGGVCTTRIALDCESLKLASIRLSFRGALGFCSADCCFALSRRLERDYLAGLTKASAGFESTGHIFMMVHEDLHVGLFSFTIREYSTKGKVYQIAVSKDSQDFYVISSF